MQHLICMVYVGRENLSNIKSKYGKKEGGGAVVALWLRISALAGIVHD